MATTTTDERYYPVGHWCAVVVAGHEVVRRFIYTADVERVARDLRRSYPDARRMKGIDSGIREAITRLGPEHPGLLLEVAGGLGLPEVKA